MNRILRKIAGALGALVIGLTSVASSAQTITYFHNDVTGSPLAATDSAGNLVWKEGYTAYGMKTVMSSAAETNRIGYAGKPYETDLDLSYMGARYYNPTFGRFMGIDPKPADPENIHAINRYAYANNNPYRFVDPDGHSPIDVVFLAYDLGKLSVALYRGDGVQDAMFNVAASVVGVASPVPFAGQAIKAARAADRGVDLLRAVDNATDGVKAAKGEAALTSRAARREAMRDAGIPTSQQPASQSRNASGREYSYDVPAPGGGTQRMSVQQQTMDRSHLGQPHWEAGRVKTDPLTGAVRQNNYGRPALANDKSKVDY